MLTHNRTEGHHHMTPTVQWRTTCQAAGPDNHTQGAQAPTTNTNNTNNQIQFQNAQRHVPSTTGPTGQHDNRYSQPSNKGLGKKASSHINTQPSISDIFT